MSSQSTPITEEWRSIPGLTLYEAGAEGHIRNQATGKLLAIREEDYSKVSVRVAGKRVIRRVHRLVAAAFLGPLPNGMEINHKDTDRHNNAVSNLEYVTRSENIRHAMETLGSYRGERHPQAQLTEEAVREIRCQNPHCRQHWQALAERYGVSWHRIRAIVYGQGWRHVHADG